MQAVLSDPRHRYRSEHVDVPAPVIVRWPDAPYIDLSDAEIHRVSRRVLFARDQWTCQYCGLQLPPARALLDLTVDHVKPAHLYPSRLAATTYDNVVAACFTCNQRKGGLLPYECGMWPGMYRPGRSYVPARPHMVQVRFAGRLSHPAQRDYIRAFFALDDLEAPVAL